MNESTPNPVQICVVMPAYNEQGCIKEVVADWLSVLSAFSGSKLIVVNDGSKDSTGEILDGLASVHTQLEVIHQKNAGHGAALYNGYKDALSRDPQWVFQVDSDNQFLASDFIKLWNQREKSEFILARREKRDDPLHRLVISSLARGLIFSLFGVYIKDANVPFRLIRGDYLKCLLEVMPQGVFAPNIFLSILAAKDGRDLRNVAVSHLTRKTGSVSIVRLTLIRACFRSLDELWGLRLSLGLRVKKLRELASLSGL